MAVYLADVAQGTTSANRNHAYSLAQAESERKYAAGVAEADSKLYLEQKKAEAALIVGQADAQGPADIAYAEAVRDRDNRYAEDTYIWIDAVASASVDYATEQFDFIEYTNLVRQADQVRADADEQAREIYQQDVDAAGVQVPLAIGGFKTAYVQSTGDAQVTHASEVGAAAHTYADESAAHDQTLTVGLAQADETHQRELLAADYTHTLGLGPQDKLFAERLRDAGVARAGGRATSEAQYQFTLATQTAAGWASLYAGSNSDQHEFQAAESAALAEWIEQLAPAFVAFAAASAQADGQLDVDLAAADATQANAEALAAKVYGNTLAAQERIRSIDLGAIANAGSVVAVDHDNAVAVDVAEANLQQALQHVAAENAYAVAADAIPRQFRANPTSAAAWQAGKDAVAERDKAFAQADFDWRLDASQAEFDFAVAEAVREEGELKAEALVEKTYSQALADAEHTQSVSLAQAERTHMIAATNAENASRGTSASANAAYLTASHAQKTAALDVLVTQLAGSLWSNFERDRAAAEASAWQTVAPSYLSWQSGVSAAYSAYTLARADAYQTSAIQIAGFVKDHARAVAQSTYTEVVQLAGIERDFGNQLANSTAQYRLEAADVEFTYATDTAEMIRTNDPGQNWTDYTRTQAMIVVNREYRDRYVGLEKARRTGFAQAGYQLVSAQAGYATSTAQLIAASQQQFDNAAANAYFVAGATGSASAPLENRLAELAYNYDVFYSTTFNTALDDLADTTATPWAEYAAAESAAEHTIVTLPLAVVTKTNRLNLAAAENEQDLAEGTAGRTQWLSELNAESNYAVMQAAQTLGTQSTAAGNRDLVTLPANLTPPDPDTGTVTLVANNYLVMHPGAISQYWVDGYFGAHWYQYPGYLANFTWNWQGEPYGYYWDDRTAPFQGSADVDDYGGIGYAGFAADYITPPNPYWGIGWTTDFGYAYGYWNYTPNLYTWHGWNPAYAGAISGASNNTTIDPKQELMAREQMVNALKQTGTAAKNMLEVAEELVFAVINTVTGGLRYSSNQSSSAEDEATDDVRGSDAIQMGGVYLGDWGGGSFKAPVEKKTDVHFFPAIDETRLDDFLKRRTADFGNEHQLPKLPRKYIPGAGTWEQVEIGGMDVRNGKRLVYREWIPVDSEARDWLEAGRLKREYEAYIRNLADQIRTAYRGAVVTWEELEEAIKDKSSGIRFVQNPNTFLGLQQVGYSVYIQDITVDGEDFKLVWARFASRPNSRSGSPTAAVIDVQHLPSGAASDAAAAKPYFDHISGAYKSASIQAAIATALLAVDAVTIGRATGIAKAIKPSAFAIKALKVEGESAARILLGEAGEVVIIGETEAVFKFTSREAAEKFLTERLGRPLTPIGGKPLEVPKAIAEELIAASRSIARMEGFDFGVYLKRLIGNPPPGMINPHAHHILYKKGLGRTQQALVEEGQAILRKHGIDPIFGVENLCWAPNRVVLQHGPEALKKVVDTLKKIDAAGGDYDDIVAALKELGRIAAQRAK